MKRTFLKFCSLALALVMVLAAFAGTFTFNVVAETPAATPTGNWTDATEITTEEVWYAKGFDSSKSIGTEADPLEWTASATLTYGDQTLFNTLMAARKAYLDHLNDNSKPEAVTTYEIADAADLAALAAAVNLTKVPNAFAGFTFTITQEIDLSAHYWVSIGTDDLGEALGFGGSLIGPEEGVTIKNMIINETTDSAAGLIGAWSGGGSVMNITLLNPIVNTTKADVGFFIGYYRSAVGTVQNLCVEGGTMKVGATSATSIGGIVGRVNVTTAVPVIKDCKVIDTTMTLERNSGGIVGKVDDKAHFDGCVFQGKIRGYRAASANLAGMVGAAAKDLARELAFTDCVVLLDLVDNTVTAEDACMGGFAGWICCDASFTRCYFGGKISLSSAASRRLGGFVGIAYNGGKTYTFTDCQMDGIIDGQSSQSGSWFGRLALTTKSAQTTVSFENCITTGISAQSYDSGRCTSWVGLLANVATNGAPADITINRCYANSQYPILGRNDYSDPKTQKVTIKQDDKDSVTYIAASATAYNGHLPRLLPADHTLPAEFSAEVWSTRSNMSPILSIAAEYADKRFAAADLSWYDATVAHRTEGFTISTNEQYLGLAYLAQLITFRNTAVAQYGFAINYDDIDVETALADLTAAEKENLATLLDNANEYSVINTDSLEVQYQTNPEGDIRFVSSVELSEEDVLANDENVVHKNMGFEITWGTKTASIDTITLYSAIYANGEQLTDVKAEFGDSAEYFFAAVLTGAPAGEQISVRAYVVLANGVTVYGEAAEITIPAAN